MWRVGKGRYACILSLLAALGLVYANLYVPNGWLGQFLAPLGIRLPVYPVKGYSITVPITDAAGAMIGASMPGGSDALASCSFSATTWRAR